MEELLTTYLLLLQLVQTVVSVWWLCLVVRVATLSPPQPLPHQQVNKAFKALVIIVSMYPSHAAPTVAPGGLTNTSKESRSLSVVWASVPCPNQGGPITGYRLRYSNKTTIVNTPGEESRQHILTGLTPFTRYFLQVAAVNDGGTGPYSTPPLIVETVQDGE